MKFRRRLVLVFALALAIRLVYFFQARDSPFFDTLLGDAQAYDAWAIEIGRDFWGKEPFFQAPLYPYFLAAIYRVFGHDPDAVRMIQALLGSGACVLLAEAGRSFFSERVGLLAGVLLACYAPALFFEGILQKASLDLFLTTLLLLLLGRVLRGARQRDLLLTGVALGLLALTRENSMIWLPIVLVWLALRERQALASFARTRAAPLLLGVTLVLGPVALRNYAVSGQLIVTTSQFGQNFYIGNNPDADGTYRSLRFGHGGAQFERTDAIELAEQATGSKLDASEVSHYWSNRAWSFIGSSPLRWSKLMLKKWLLVWNARELPDSDEPAVYEDASWLLAGLDRVLSFGTLFPIALVGAVLASNAGRLLHWLALGLSASIALFFVVERYRYPLVPILLLFAAFALLRVHELWRERNSPALAGALGVAALGVLVSRVELVPPVLARATAYYDLGVSLEADDRVERAQASYERALSANPNFVEAHINLGALLARSGKLDTAAQHERAALELRPEDALAHALLGNVLFEQGRLTDAESHYRSALRADPAQAQARDGLSALRDEQQRARPVP